MFYLHVSNRTENLLRHLAEVLSVVGRSDLFAKEIFLIQSKGMERMISQAMAKEFRSWCNFEYLLPFEFLAAVAGKLGMQITPDGYDRKILTWRLESLLRDLDEEIYSELAGYIKGDNAALKRFQLSYRLANVFDQYQMMRPDMLAAWDAGKLSTDQSSERWQAALWQRLAQGADGVLHRGVLVRLVIEALRTRTDLAGILPGRISVFGLHIMPPLFLECLQGLSRHCDIHLYLLSPCRQYWGDIEGERGLIKKRLAGIEKGGSMAIEVRDRHPLLASLGGQGRDFQEMLLKGVEVEMEFNSFEDPVDDSEPTLLHRLQSDILQDRSCEAGKDGVSGDDSLIIVSCHSRLREIEILKDHILHLLYKDPELKLRDIIVMAPDIHDYASLIPAVFNDIQHSVADRSLRRFNRFINVFLAFLELFDGRFGWTEVLDLLKHEVVYPNFDLSFTDLDTLERWVPASGIRWGLSADQRREMGLPGFAENTWSFGLDRLLMGFAIDTDEMVDGVLPFADIEGTQTGILGGLCAFVGLCERAGRDFQQQRSLAQWSNLLLNYTESLFGDPEGGDLLELRELLVALSDRYAEFHDHPVDIKVIRAWLSQSVQESRSGSGFLRGSLTFCSMLPMRSIPFKVVCLLGMGDSEFPRTDSWATFDLMAPPRSRPGDRSARLDDRYQFLEAILAARQTLLISYVGRSIKSNEIIPPSVVVSELLECLQTAYGVNDLVTEHPLQPFSARYFTGREKGLFSYNAQYCATATRFRIETDTAPPWWTQKLDVPAPESIGVRDLLSFFADPQRYFVRNLLEIRLAVEREIPEDREPFVIEGLDAYLIDQEILAECLLRKDATRLLARLKAEGRWTLGTPGETAFSRKYSELRDFADRIETLHMGARQPDLTIDLKIGKYRLKGVLPDIYENGIMLARYAKLKGKDLLIGWIHHLLLGLFPGCTQRTVVVARDKTLNFAGCEKPKPDLNTLLDLFVDGCRRPSPLIVEPAFAYARQLNAPRSQVSPLEKAERSLQECLDNGYEPEWSLLFRNREMGDILDSRFEDVALKILNPIWMQADDR